VINQYLVQIIFKTNELVDIIKNFKSNASWFKKNLYKKTGAAIQIFYKSKCAAGKTSQTKCAAGQIF